ncbi:MAG: DUF3866 family protein, partial [Actinobacteria bacterium]|nr:DUF3866 family protein [Actinomycetota bacterium]
MAAFRTCRVSEILEQTDELVRTKVDSDTGALEAIGWPRMFGSLDVGDRVVVNTTGLDLDLGTGGVGFILWNLDGSGAIEAGPGHIIKMRYTPWQTEVMAADAPESPHHAALKDVTSI